MAWTVELSPGVDRQLDKLDPKHARRILKFLFERLARLEDPRSIGGPLQGQLREYWKYRVGDYRVLCALQDERLVALVVKIGHRSEVYRR